jgi:FG-GAP-like repeat/ASPIC and UnbV
MGFEPTTTTLATWHSTTELRPRQGSENIIEVPTGQQGVREKESILNVVPVFPQEWCWQAVACLPDYGYHPLGPLPSSSSARSVPRLAIPMSQTLRGRPVVPITVGILVVGLLAGATVVWRDRLGGKSPSTEPVLSPSEVPPVPRRDFDDSGQSVTYKLQKRWTDGTSFEQVREAFREAGHRHLPLLDGMLAQPNLPPEDRLDVLLKRASVLLYEGDTGPASEVLADTRRFVEADPHFARDWLSTVIFLQGVAALRRGETDNCILCRGESSCIVPIAPSALHRNPYGSREAIRYFVEYLDRHPDDLAVRWLLAIAAMTVGEYPAGIAERYRLPGDPFRSSMDVGRFRDIGDRIGINRFNQAGGCILEDFDGDGLLDVITTSWDSAMPMTFFKNMGNGTFEDRAAQAGLKNQLGGLYCVQTDFNNDGFPDVLVVRGAWWNTPVRPSLLKNNGNGTFTDVTAAAGVMQPVNAITAQWADYDNDGYLDFFIGAERGRNLLYRNKGDGTFEEVAVKAGVAGNAEQVKGVAWGDFDGDGYPDLFLNCIEGPRLFHNNRNGTFTDVTGSMGITGPKIGFSCWFFDFDNDGWPDLLANSYERSVDDIVLGLLDKPTSRETGRLYRNLGGKKFQDVTREMGFDKVLGPMGSNFADFDHDGFLDFYCGTGWPRYSALVPNRLFKNVGGKRFVDISMSSGTAHLQKGHAVAWGDWARDGNVDLFIEMGGASPGDQFHNILFRNPGTTNHWLNVKLVGVKTNRPAVGARIKAVIAGPDPLTVYRHVSSGSSFGANPFEQCLGLGKATKVDRLEVYWPTSGTTQVFTNVDADQYLEITEFADAPRKLNHKRIPLPPEKPGG